MLSDSLNVDGNTSFLRPFCFVASLPLFVVNESYESIAVI